jgi:hypothetical protein
MRERNGSGLRDSVRHRLACATRNNCAERERERGREACDSERGECIYEYRVKPEAVVLLCLRGFQYKRQWVCLVLKCLHSSCQFTNASKVNISDWLMMPSCIMRGKNHGTLRI